MIFASACRWFLGFVLVCTLLPVVAIFCFSDWNSDNKYVLVAGHVKQAETSTIPLVKGGEVVFAKVEYEFEYEGKTFNSRQLTCDSAESTSAHLSKFERVRFIEQLVLQLKNANRLGVWIRKDAPNPSCLLREGRLTEYK